MTADSGTGGGRGGEEGARSPVTETSGAPVRGLAVVTGAAGFVGSHLVRALARGGARVRAVDDLSVGTRAALAWAAHGAPGRVSFVRADLSDPAAAREAVDGAEVVFHQAAARSVQRSVDDPAVAHAANATATLNLLVAARDAGVRRVVYASSSSVYGDARVLPTAEDEPLRPCSPYAASKAAGELYCRSFARTFGLETVALRYFNVYGPRQDGGSPYATVVPIWTEALLSGAPVVVQGDGRQSRDFTFVEDVVRANLLAAAAPAAAVAGEAFNVSGGAPHDLVAVLRALERLTGRTADVRSAPPRDGDVRATHADLRRAGAALAYAPRVALAEGLARTVAWFRARGASAARPAPRRRAEATSAR